MLEQSFCLALSIPLAKASVLHMVDTTAQRIAHALDSPVLDSPAILSAAAPPRNLLYPRPIEECAQHMTAHI